MKLAGFVLLGLVWGTAYGMARRMYQTRRQVWVGSGQDIDGRAMGAFHHRYCLVARYPLERSDPDGFPWCTCEFRRTLAPR